MKKLIQWLKRVVVWLAEPRVAWLTLVVIGLSIAFVTHLGVTEREIRFTGLILQCLGIGTVAWGIRQTQKLFGWPGLFPLLRDWLANFQDLAAVSTSGRGTSSVAPR